MSDEADISLPADRLAALISPEQQRQAARMAQDGFARLFALSAGGDAGTIEAAVGEMLPLCRNWARAGGSEDAQALRLALLVAGMDQWGLAYSQAFGLAAIPALSALLGALRTGLDAAADARFSRQYAALEAVETDAVDFKMQLRRNIHLALWHAMIACPTTEEAAPILRALGSLLCALVGRMPRLGWRLAADTLAHIQIRCLGEGAAATEAARENNDRLFAALRANLPADKSAAIFALAGEAAVAWQRARNLAREQTETEPLH